MSKKNKIQLLLVDEQEANLTVLASVLAELDEILVSVSSGEQALRNFASGMRFPGLLVALTGWGAHDDLLQSERAGFDQHLTKPVDFAALETVFAAVARARP